MRGARFVAQDDDHVAVDPVLVRGDEFDHVAEAGAQPGDDGVVRNRRQDDGVIGRRRRELGTRRRRRIADKDGRPIAGGSAGNRRRNAVADARHQNRLVGAIAGDRANQAGGPDTLRGAARIDRQQARKCRQRAGTQRAAEPWFAPRLDRLHGCDDRPDLVEHRAAGFEHAFAVDPGFRKFGQAQQHELALRHLVAVAGGAGRLEPGAHQRPLIGVLAVARNARGRRARGETLIGEMLGEVACVVEPDRRAPEIGEAVRERRVAAREAGEFSFVAGGALDVVDLDDVGQRALVLGVAHLARHVAQFRPLRDHGVVGRARRAAEGVAVGAVRGVVRRGERRGDPVGRSAAVRRVAARAIARGDEAGVSGGQRSRVQRAQAAELVGGLAREAGNQRHDQAERENRQPAA